MRSIRTYKHLTIPELRLLKILKNYGSSAVGVGIVRPQAKIATHLSKLGLVSVRDGEYWNGKPAKWYYITAKGRSLIQRSPILR